MYAFLKLTKVYSKAERISTKDVLKQLFKNK
jgi:hypothetical protein